VESVTLLAYRNGAPVARVCAFNRVTKNHNKSGRHFRISPCQSRSDLVCLQQVLR
jgi:hypothetical protein